MQDIQQDTNSVNNTGTILPVVALRGKTLFPRTILNFEVGRKKSVLALNSAKASGGELAIISQKNAFIENPKIEDMLTVGVRAKIKQIVKVNDNNIKVTVEALSRVKVLAFNDGEFLTAELVEAPYTECEDQVNLEANLRIAKGLFLNFAMLDKRISKEVIGAISETEDANFFIDQAMNVVNLKENDVHALIEIDDTLLRLKEFIKLFARESEIAGIEKKIAETVRQNIDKSQKEFYLREQIKAIHQELGEGDDDSAQLTEKIKEKNLPKEIEDKLLKEVSRLDRINPSSPDYSIILNYIDCILDLPFNVYTEDTKDISVAKEILDKDHFGLEKVKQRIVEYLAVLHLTGELKGPILCFVGPPGVGKTSVATSIARATGRKFVRMSLGGVKDEAEIRGHRKTYVGAMPGRIITGLKNAGSMNPVFLLDEIDKLSSDIHGDPASALLEVLDPEQNATFRDRFTEIPFDLSKVLFITTANSLETIPTPLLDRMEVIELTGYTDREKSEIAKRYLVPKQLKNNGLTENKIEITDDAIDEIIEGYTMEAGVRNLEREIGSVIRKVAVKVAEHPRIKKQVIRAKDIFDYLGIKKRLKDRLPDTDEVGSCTGLAWTSIGGTTLTIEVSLMKGKSEILLTGKLGDVMKESARTAISYIRSHAKQYDIDADIFEKTDIHIHVPEGATPKDGPSAGITMATAILSAFTGRPVRKDIAMTGEITLRGRVLAIGGLKEKAIAAFRQGIKTVIIPMENQKDLTDIPKEVRDNLIFCPVKQVSEVFDKAIIFNK